MDFQKAISILGLKSNFTEEELKKAHRRLSMKYHPDKHEGTDFYEEAVTKQQEINSAYDYLKKQKNNIDLSAYRTQKAEEIKQTVEFDFDKYNESFPRNIQRIIATIKTTGITFTVFIVNKNKQEIDDIFQQTLNEIKDNFRKLKTEFYQENYIDESDVKTTLNYNCTLQEFYEQLTNIKDKYSKESLVKKRLEEEIQKYQYYAGYEELKPMVNFCQKQSLMNIKINKFQNIEEEIQKMHQQINTEVFEAYYSLQSQINELDGIVAAIDNEEIKNKYSKLKKDFERGGAFADAEEGIKSLNILIDEYLKKVQSETLFKKNTQAVNDIYLSLITRYSETMKSYNITTRYDDINDLNISLQEILELFQEGCKEYRDLEYFKLFDEITFKDSLNDTKTIKKIIENIKGIKSKVYIKKRFFSFKFDFKDDISFFYLDAEQMIMYKIESGEKVVSNEKISEEELEDFYMPIEEFLDKSTFIGENRMDAILRGPIIFLYEMNSRLLYRERNIFKITNDKNSLTIISVSEGRDNLEKYQNKKHVSSSIAKQLREVVEEYQKSEQMKGQVSEERIPYSVDELNKKFGSYKLRTYEDESSPNPERKRKK